MFKNKYFTRKKVCKFCTEKIEIDYKNIQVLKSFLTDRGKIIPKRITGSCAFHQRWLTDAIKKARNIALLAFVEK